MENSYRYFENRDCKYYPCHAMEELNCLFCYCPLYTLEKCPGTYTRIEKNGKTIKSCLNCTFPHKEENYDILVALLKRAQSGKTEIQNNAGD